MADGTQIDKLSSKNVPAVGTTKVTGGQETGNIVIKFPVPEGGKHPYPGLVIERTDPQQENVKPDNEGKSEDLPSEENKIAYPVNEAPNAKPKIFVPFPNAELQRQKEANRHDEAFLHEENRSTEAVLREEDRHDEAVQREGNLSNEAMQREGNRHVETVQREGNSAELKKQHENNIGPRTQNEAEIRKMQLQNEAKRDEYQYKLDSMRIVHGADRRPENNSPKVDIEGPTEQIGPPESKTLPKSGDDINFDKQKEIISICDEFFRAIDGPGTHNKLLEDVLKKIDDTNVLEVMDQWDKGYGQKYGETFIQSFLYDASTSQRKYLGTKIIEAFESRAMKQGISLEPSSSASKMLMQKSFLGQQSIQEISLSIERMRYLTTKGEG